MIEIGKRVVCIYDGVWHDPSGLVLTVHPLFRRTYLVTDIYPCHFMRERWGLMFGDLFGCRCWLSSDFRPVEERDTSIAVFKKLLAPTEPVADYYCDVGGFRIVTRQPRSRRTSLERTPTAIW